MSNQLSIFNFEDHQVRTLLINNEPWFIAVDVCKALKITNHRDALLKLDDDEKGVGLTDTLGGKQEMLIINESGLFTLILRCRDAVNKGTLPHRFRKWVTGEVLPSIRKTGKYELPQKTTVDQRTPLRDAVNLLVSKKAITYSEAYSIIHQRFNVASIEDLQQDQLSQAVEYVHKVALEGEYIPHQKEQLITMSIENFYDLAWICNAARYMHKRIAKITPALDAIESDHYGVFRSMAVDYRATISSGVNTAIDIVNKYQIPNLLADGRYFPNLEKTI